MVEVRWIINRDKMRLERITRQQGQRWRRAFMVDDDALALRPIHRTHRKCGGDLFRYGSSPRSRLPIGGVVCVKCSHGV